MSIDGDTSYGTGVFIQDEGVSGSYNYLPLKQEVFTLFTAEAPEGSNVLPGTYLYQVYVTAFPGIFLAGHVVNYVNYITVIVEPQEVILTFSEVLNLIVDILSVDQSIPKSVPVTYDLSSDPIVA